MPDEIVKWPKIHEAAEEGDWVENDEVKGYIRVIFFLLGHRVNFIENS